MDLISSSTANSHVPNQVSWSMSDMELSKWTDWVFWNIRSSLPCVQLRFQKPYQRTVSRKCRPCWSWPWRKSRCKTAHALSGCVSALATHSSTPAHVYGLGTQQANAQKHQSFNICLVLKNAKSSHSRTQAVMQWSYWVDQNAK